MASDAKKLFVIDTNVFIHNPEAVNSFRDTEIAIPLTVLEELDKLKTYADQRGRNAREAIRFLDSLIKGGDARHGIRLENGSLLRVIFGNVQKAPPELSLDSNDNRILLQAAALRQDGRRVFFVSKDINARVKAGALGLKVVDYEKQKVDAANLYQGYREADADAALMDALERGENPPWRERLQDNEFLMLREKTGKRSSLRRWKASEGLLSDAGEEREAFGVTALNDRQKAALDLLMDDSVRCVTLVGRAGTGKTLLAVAAALKKTVDEKAYSRILVSRPIVPLGKDIGYLPGEKTVKLSAWMEPIFDNLEHLLAVGKRQNFKSIDQLLRDRVIEIEAVTYIRGRSLPNQFIIIDEAQNLTPHEIKTIVSRAGEGSKMVFTGDPEQIDNLYLDANSNGLSYLVDAFKGHRIYGHVKLEKTERSELAELAARLL
ncbi:MAG: phosphate starvation-inducible protein PhoH [Treponema sp. GWB1_62_6]|nr:MAG: phosphate starvation-inducible protein PhoH [Treponema sp. GWB1_62_6]OHE67856.1 MAG: phosphate starvation-inducible protein PhoH [Treponema sp. GWC1_61_84]OHE74160.1 MAG: phosphate starvation-inducible protein PhoH [Treponema sp. RIFOXYC1_FULL_61_9]HCM27292.1 phosphate starvation-inducible protein PhoH [Treponema sp.]